MLCGVGFVVIGVVWCVGVDVVFTVFVGHCVVVVCVVVMCIVFVFISCSLFSMCSLFFVLCYVLCDLLYLFVVI